MMSGGRIMQHVLHYVSLPTTRILFVGYQAEETMGRDILEGVQSVVIDDKQKKVRASVREIKTLSSHADQPRLMTWLSHIKGVQQVFLTHGEKVQREMLAEKIKKDLGIQAVHTPGYEESFEL
jgi:metallo-beta-lactamase family protein